MQLQSIRVVNGYVHNNNCKGESTLRDHGKN